MHLIKCAWENYTPMTYFRLKYTSQVESLMPRWRNGIRSGFKNLWEQSREGSIPSLGTRRNLSLAERFFIVIKGDRTCRSQTRNGFGEAG